MKIIGLMVARDEEAIVPLTLRSVSGLIDELIFIDHASKDRTYDTVLHTCNLLGIKVYPYQFGPDKTLKELRQFAMEEARKIDHDWTFTVDADMWFIYTDMIRNLAEVGKYDAYWFRTLNFSMDLFHISGLNPPHVWLIRNKKGVNFGANYMVPRDMFRSDPNKDRFIGYNMTYLKPIERIFWRRHIPGQRHYNQIHGTNRSVDEYMHRIYGDDTPEMKYMQQFVLGIFQKPTDTIEDEARYGKRTWDLAKPAPYDENEYGPIPEELLTSKLSNYKMLFNTEGECTGRHPDLIL